MLLPPIMTLVFLVTGLQLLTLSKCDTDSNGTEQEYTVEKEWNGQEWTVEQNWVAEQNRDTRQRYAQNQWTAQQLVMRVSDGNLCRGFFICNDEARMMKKRWKAIEVKDTIEFSGSSLTDSFFSRSFEEESTSQNFMQSVDSHGTKVSVDANANYLFVSAQAGGSVSYDKKHSKQKTTTKSKRYFSSIKGYNIPTKSVDLDPMYMLLNQEVLDELKKYENISIGNEDQKLRFIDFFEKYGSHYHTGTIELGGTLIAKGTTSIQSGSISAEVKDTVNKATDAYLDISATFASGGGGVSVKTSANDLKSHLSSSLDEKTLKSITLDFQKKGGPPGEDSIEKWKKGLVEQSDTWRIIDKFTELIPIWKILLIHHKDQFNNAENLASQLKEAWEYIIALPSFYLESVDSQTMSELAAEIRELGISPALADKRKQLLIDMVSRSKLKAQEDTRYAHIHITPGGQIVMSSLQEEPLEKDTTIIPYLNIMLMSTIPHVIYLKLEYKNVYLGHIIIELTGYTEYPRQVQQFLELSTGDNNVGGSWRGSGFTDGLFGRAAPGNGVYCGGYMNASGLQRASLFPVEEGPNIAPVVGQVLGYEGQRSGFIIVTQSWTDQRPYPLIGSVTSGLEILQAVAVRGGDFFKDIKFTNCGLVVID